MRFAKIFKSLGLLSLVGGAIASNCINPVVRKEWRELSLLERVEYLGAVQCLAHLPDVTGGLENATNLFESFQATHSSKNGEIHWVGFFILWHRYFTATYEKYLRESCGYKGAQPYWNWALDTDAKNNASMKVYESEIFDGVLGFGGNGKYVSVSPEENPFNLTGRTGGGCVETGPFREGLFSLNVKHPLGQPECLRRDFIPWILNWFGRQSQVDHVQSQDDYTSFARALENIPAFTQPNIHGSGHFGVGGVLGTLGNSALSPGDPLFYMHHANLDRILWQWQQKDKSTRYHQVGGPITPFDYSGKNVTLDYEVNIGRLAGSRTLEELLNTEGDALCYTYEN